MIIQVLCEVCSSADMETGKCRSPVIIATADTDKLSLPLKSEMFLPEDPAHNPGFYPLGRPEAEWEWLRCPYCHHRPLYHRDKVLTPEGYYTVSTIPDKRGEEEKLKPAKLPKSFKVGNKFICRDCGKLFKSRNGLNAHMKVHK